MASENNFVRASLGTAIAIKLIDGWTKIEPKTAYLLTYHDEKCQSDCGFCSLARNSESRRDMVSRVIWPKFELDAIANRLSSIENKNKIERVCIQAMNYETVFGDVLHIIDKIKSKSVLPISLSIQLINTSQIRKLVGIIDRISIPIDAVNKTLFERIKGNFIVGSYEWDNRIDSLLEAVKYFGEAKVTTHFIVGLGETDFEIIEMIQWAIDNGIVPSLFAFTPIKGTRLENLNPPELPRYRSIQIAHNMLIRNRLRIENIEFNTEGRLCDFGISKKELFDIMSDGCPFMTFGCPSCDRPYFNERVTGPIYNFPYKPSNDELISIKEQIRQYIRNKVL